MCVGLLDPGYSLKILNFHFRDSPPLGITSGALIKLQSGISLLNLSHQVTVLGTPHRPLPYWRCIQRSLALVLYLLWDSIGLQVPYQMLSLHFLTSQRALSFECFRQRKLLDILDPQTRIVINSGLYCN